MNNNFIRQAIRVIKQVFVKSAITFGPIILIILIVVIIISGLWREFTIQEGTYQEGNRSNVPFIANEYIEGITIDGEGNITSSKTASEIWNELLKYNSNIGSFLNRSEELLKLMNAEVITQYLDTRPNPDEEIDWEALMDVNSNKIQGIIKLKRAMSDGTTSTMTYVDPETFQMYIDNYNETGSDEDRQIALSHFTLEKTYLSNNTGNATPITAGTVINIPAGLGSVHTYMGWQLITDTSSRQYQLIEQAGMNFDEEGFGKINGRYVIACTTTFGQVGDYIDFYQEDGSIIPCIIGDIKSQSDEGCNEWGHLNGTCIVEFVVDVNTWYDNGHPNPGQDDFHPEWNQNIVKAVNGGSYFENQSFGTDTIKENEESTKEALYWPTDSTIISSEFGYRDQPTEGASTNHRGIDIGVDEGTNVYACEAGTVTTAMYSESAGNYIVIDHGNGYISKYMHNSSLKVEIGDVVKKGQIIALSGNTGISTGAHLHFQIELNGNPVDPLTFSYENGMGGGTSGIGSSVGSSTSQYYAKIATWKEVTDIIETTDPEVEEHSTTTYTMTTTKINYQQLVKGYTMPFEYLWALLVTGQEKQFVMEIADLVYNSELEITVHDNVVKTTDIDTYDYIRKTLVDTHDINIYVKYGLVAGEMLDARVEGLSGTKELSERYQTVHTVETTTNTVDISLTKADVWIVDYKQEYSYEVPNSIENTSDPTAMEPIEYPETPNMTNRVDAAGIAEEQRNSVANDYSNFAEVDADILSFETDYYYGMSGSITNYNKNESTRYISSPATVKEKTGKGLNENNFVTIFLKSENYTARNNILSIKDWLYEILAKNEKTADMVDLTKYLMYKATGIGYNNIKEYDFELFKPENFNTVGEENENNGENGTVYYQDDYAFVPYGSSTLATSGCGPVSFAMIASDYLNRQLTPIEAIEWCGNNYYVYGAGTSWAYFKAAAKHFNLPCEVVDLGNSIEAAAEELRKGNLVISSQEAGIFTRGGHFIVLSSIDENGEISVRDPNKTNAIDRGYNNRKFSMSEISQSACNYWSFQK